MHERIESNEFQVHNKPLSQPLTFHWGALKKDKGRKKKTIRAYISREFFINYSARVIFMYTTTRNIKVINNLVARAKEIAVNSLANTRKRERKRGVTVGRSESNSIYRRLKYSHGSNFYYPYYFCYENPHFEYS